MNNKRERAGWLACLLAGVLLLVVSCASTPAPRTAAQKYGMDDPAKRAQLLEKQRQEEEARKAQHRRVGLSLQQARNFTAYALEEGITGRNVVQERMRQDAVRRYKVENAMGAASSFVFEVMDEASGAGTFNWHIKQSHINRYNVPLSVQLSFDCENLVRNRAGRNEFDMARCMEEQPKLRKNIGYLCLYRKVNIDTYDFKRGLFPTREPDSYTEANIYRHTGQDHPYLENTHYQNTYITSAPIKKTEKRYSSGTLKSTKQTINNKVIHIKDIDIAELMRKNEHNLYYQCIVKPVNHWVWYGLEFVRRRSKDNPNVVFAQGVIVEDVYCRLVITRVNSSVSYENAGRIIVPSRVDRGRDEYIPCKTP